jgi:tetratricopeptide (TPR) repeat protein
MALIRDKVVDNTPQAPGSSKRGRGVSACAALLIIATLAVFWRVTHQDFVHWDDHGHVFANPYLQRLDAANLLHFWKEPYEHLYIPLSYMAFALLCAISRMPHHDPSVTVIETLYNPHVFHTANLILHTLNVLLVFAILRRLLNKTGSTAPALLGALLFGVHPLQVESVAWISELRGQLSSAFCLGTIYAYVAAVQKSPTRPSACAAYWLAFILTVLGLLCKPSIITAGLLLVILDRWMLGREWRAVLASAAPWLVLAVPFTLLTQHAQPVSGDWAGAVWQRPFVAGDALAFYLTKLFVPVNLAIEYGRRPDNVLKHTWAYLTWLAPASIALLIFLARKNRPWLVVGGLMSLAVLLPVLGLVPFAYQVYSTVADRYIYIAMLGPALMVAWGLQEALSRGYGKAAIGAASVAVAALAVLTVQQLRYWDNSAALFGHAIRINPNSYGLRTNYGISLDDVGRFDEAVAQYRAATKIMPDFPDAYQDMGVSLQHEGKADEAMDCFRQAIAIDPDYELGHAAIGLTLLTEGRPADALPELALAAKLAPADAQNLAHYGAALQQLGRADEAADAYRASLAVNPANVSALTGLAALDIDAGRLDDAESESRRAVQISPKDPKAHAALAGVLDKAGRADESIAEYRQAIALDPSVDALHFGLGSVLFKSGDRNDAIPELEKAAQLGPTATHYDQLGVAYATVGNMTGARQEFEAAAKADPHYAPALKHIAMLAQH